MAERRAVQYTISIISQTGNQFIIPNLDVINFTFIEDIFSLVPVAKLDFYDRGGAIEALPIMGREIVTIAWQQSNITSDPTSVPENKAMAFVVYDVNFNSEIQTAGSALSKVELYLVDPYFLKLNHFTYSRSWAGVKGTEIIEHICKHMMLSGAINMEWANIEECNETFDSFIMPYWTPSQTIKWIMKRISGTKSKEPGYLFYNNTKGFNLWTIGSIMQQQPEQEKYQFTQTEEEKYFNDNKILGFKIYPPSNQALSRIAGSIKNSPNFEKREQREEIKFGSEIIENYKGVFHGASALYKDPNIANNSVESAAGTYQTLNNMYGDEWIKRYIKQLQLDIMVAGSTKRYAGMMININWQSMLLYNQPNNVYYTGRYLVRSITHQFIPNAQPSYRQLMVCSKTAFDDTSSISQG